MLHAENSYSVFFMRHKSGLRIFVEGKNKTNLNFTLKIIVKTVIICFIFRPFKGCNQQRMLPVVNTKHCYYLFDVPTLLQKIPPYLNRIIILNNYIPSFDNKSVVISCITSGTVVLLYHNFIIIQLKILVLNLHLFFANIDHLHVFLAWY